MGNPTTRAEHNRDHLRHGSDLSDEEGHVLEPLLPAPAVQEQIASVHHFHVELDRPDILLAEELPVESYLETGNRAQFANDADHVALHPDFAPLSWTDDACAPLCLGGPRVMRVRAQLAARTERVAGLRSAEADLRVLAGGRLIRPATARGGMHRIPAAAR